MSATADAPEDVAGSEAGDRSGLEALLADAALGPGPRTLPGRPALKAVAKLAVRPQRVVGRGLGLASEAAKIVAGRSEVEPKKSDKRWKDPAWQANPAFHRLAQAYLATGQAVDGLIGDADLDWQAERRLRFAVDNVLDALAPTNFPLTNPTVLKATVDTGGRHFVKGAKALARDMARPPRIPTMVDTDAFTLGEDIAVTPGAVVLRTGIFELLQYRPATETVRETPLLLVPPMINKYYVADLAPGRSMIEFLVAAGQQVFAMSWRNPGKEQSDWGLDDYAGAVIDALDAVERITGQDSTHVMGLCAGGITASCAVNHLAAEGEQDRVAGLLLGVTALDQHRAGMAGAMIDRGTASLAEAESYRKGYVDGRALAGVFAWLRPNDLIWNYWVNNYLLGKDPPAFDVLFWNADQTRMPARLHRDFMELALDNALVHPGRATVLGSPVDLSRITIDSYLVAAIGDHIIPWENAYSATRLLGSEPRFVLSTSGHIAAMVNPPGNEKATYKIADSNPDDPQEWLDRAATNRGSWWEDWTAWLGERSGDDVPAPESLGGGGLEPLEDAPGTYVHQG